MKTKNIIILFSVVIFATIPTYSVSAASGYAYGNDAVVDTLSGAEVENQVIDNSTLKPSNSQVLLSEERFNPGMINNPLGLIEGRAAGVLIAKPDGSINGEYATRIRGISGLFGGNAPAVIVDGVIGASLENIDPNDIESFEILKDVAATALYGIRGSKGVILVKTKRGNSEKPIIRYNAYFNMDKAIRLQEHLSREEFIGLSKKMGVTDNDFGQDTDWYDEVLQSGLSTVHHLSISGGTENTNYYISGNFRGVNGILRNTGFDRYNTRFNLSHRTLNNKLLIGVNIGATMSKIKPGNTGVIKFAAAYNPTSPVRSEEI